MRWCADLMWLEVGYHQVTISKSPLVTGKPMQQCSMQNPHFTRCTVRPLDFALRSLHDSLLYNGFWNLRTDLQLGFRGIPFMTRLSFSKLFLQVLSPKSLFKTARDCSFQTQKQPCNSIRVIRCCGLKSLEAAAVKLGYLFETFDRMVLFAHCPVSKQEENSNSQNIRMCRINQIEWCAMAGRVHLKVHLKARQNSAAHWLLRWSDLRSWRLW